MKKIEFKLLTDKDGNELFTEFLKELPKKDRLKILSVISNIEEEGMQVAIKMGWVKKIDKNLFEIRSSLGNNIQRAFYFQVIDNEYVITHGFTKKTQKTPIREITLAKNLRFQYLKRREK